MENRPTEKVVFFTDDRDSGGDSDSGQIPFFKQLSKFVVRFFHAEDTRLSGLDKSAGAGFAGPRKSARHPAMYTERRDRKREMCMVVTCYYQYAVVHSVATFHNKEEGPSLKYVMAIQQSTEKPRICPAELGHMQRFHLQFQDTAHCANYGIHGPTRTKKLLKSIVCIFVCYGFLVFWAVHSTRCLPR